MKNVINVGRKHFILKSFISSFGRKQLSCQALFPLRRPETFILQGFYFSPSTGNSYLEKCHFLSVDRKQLSCKVYISSSSTGNIYLARFSFPYRRPETFILKVFISSPSAGNSYIFLQGLYFFIVGRKRLSCKVFTSGLHRPETVILQGRPEIFIWTNFRFLSVGRKQTRRRKEDRLHQYRPTQEPKHLGLL